MTARLPTLSPLRAFGAAARLGRISAAARELSLTQSAVSHEVKALETWFGTALFRRTRAGLVLTGRGQQVCSIAQGAFAELSQLAPKREGGDLSGTVTIAAPPLFCAYWLLPRLDRFARANPGVAFRILNVTQDRPELLREVDIAITWGADIPPGHKGVTLIPARQIPVASPALAMAADAPGLDALLHTHRILHEGNTRMWRNWFEKTGATAVDSPSRWVFDDPALMVEACMRGFGIALGTLPLIDGLLAEGRLVTLCPEPIPAPFQYILSRPDPPSAPNAAGAVYDWLRAVADARPACGPTDCSR